MWPSRVAEVRNEETASRRGAVHRLLRDAFDDGAHDRQPPQPGRRRRAARVAAVRRRERGRRCRGVRRPARGAPRRARDARGGRARHVGQGALPPDRLRRERDEDHPGALTMRPLLVALAAIAGLQPFGCAQNTMYRWGGYDQALYDHYKNPQKRDEFVAKLSGIIQQAEATGGLVPPGCYAEYGWALYEEGRTAEAGTYFEKESKRWAEARPLMEKLIRNAARAKAPAPAAPAGPPT